MDLNLVFLYFRFLILPLLGIIAPIGFLIFIILMPKTSRKMYAAKIRKDLACLLAIISKGQLRFVKAYDFAPGWISTEEGKKCMVPLPPKDKENWSPEDDLINKRTWLPDVGVPVLFCYEMDAIAVNGEVMAHLDAATIDADTTVKIQAGNPDSKTFKVLFPIDPSKVSQAIKNWISEEHLSVFEKEIEDKTRSKLPRMDIKEFAIKFGTIIGAVTIVCILAMIFIYNQTLGAQTAQTSKLILSLIH